MMTPRFEYVPNHSHSHRLNVREQLKKDNAKIINGDVFIISDFPAKSVLKFSC